MVPALPWSPEEDAVLVASGNLRVTASVLGRTYDACKTRRRFLRAIDADDFGPCVQDSRDFLDALRKAEAPPATLSIKPGRPAYAPIGYDGSSCGSAMAACEQASSTLIDLASSDRRLVYGAVFKGISR